MSPALIPPTIALLAVLGLLVLHLSGRHLSPSWAAVVLGVLSALLAVGSLGLVRCGYGGWVEDTGADADQPCVRASEDCTPAELGDAPDP